MVWKKSFKEGKELVLVTCSNSGNPNANIVISLGFIEDKLLMADCQMKTTIKNLKENKRIAVIGGYYRINGIAELSDSGKYFDICAEKSKGYKVKNAVLVNIKKVFDLDKQKTEFAGL
ncbi:MAG: pyridoxamine 5'-phosphate oxidase family protein [Candidatus Diapherotrites archaeon]